MPEAEPKSPSQELAGADAIEVAAWMLVGFALLAVLWLHLLPALLAGLLVYELVTSPRRCGSGNLSNERAGWWRCRRWPCWWSGWVTALVTWLVRVPARRRGTDPAAAENGSEVIIPGPRHSGPVGEGELARQRGTN